MMSLDVKDPAKNDTRKRKAASLSTTPETRSSGKSSRSKSLDNSTRVDSQPDSLDDFQTVTEGGVKKLLFPTKKRIKLQIKDPTKSADLNPKPEKTSQEAKSRGCILTTCLTGEQQEIVKQVCEMLGGFKLVKEWTGEVTHLITTDPPKRTLKVLNSLAKVPFFFLFFFPDFAC